MGGVTHLLLLLWVGVTVSTAVDLQKRIVRGARCRNTERLYHVKLVDNKNNFVCGGSLITDQWILTAAHCEQRAKKAVVGVHPGTNKIVQTPEKSEIYTDKNGPKHDIMLWKLPKPTGLKPVNLPGDKNCPRPSIKKVQIAGHGSSSNNCARCKDIEPRTNDLQCANIGVIDCPWITSRSAYKKPQNHVFCGDTANADACYGDSGGGVVHNDMIYGVIAGVYPIACTAPVVFMDVCSYMGWINKTIT